MAETILVLKVRPSNSIRWSWRKHSRLCVDLV